MRVCAIRRGEYISRSCLTIQNDFRYRLLPGGQVTVHFNQLVVANVITIRKAGLLTLCEVDVLGTKVVLAPLGQSFGGLCKVYEFW